MPVPKSKSRRTGGRWFVPGLVLTLSAVPGLAIAQGQAPPQGAPPRLAEGAARALETYPAIAAARAQARASGHEVRAAQWLRYPSLSVGAVTGDDRVDDIGVTFEAFQPLWSGGRIASGIDYARARRRTAEATVAETELDVLLRLSAAYFEAMRAQRLSAIIEESLAEHHQLVASMERRVAQEVSPRSDLELAISRAAQVEQELAAMQAQGRAAATRFRVLVGDPNFDLGPPPPYSTFWHDQADDRAVDQALECHPRIARFSAEAVAAEAEQRRTRAEVMPTFGLQYSHDRYGGHQFGFALRMQTNGGLAPLAQADAAAARRLAAEQGVAQASQEVSEAVTLDLVENRSARQRISGGAAAAESSASVTASFLRQFTAGRRTWLDVMNAVRERATARLTVVEIEISAMASSTRIQLNSCAWRGAVPSEAS